jgi:hypothetical protein
MKMTNFAALLGNLFTIGAIPKNGGSTNQSHADCQNKIWKDWHKKIDQMAKRRFPWDEALAMEAATYILLERLPKDCEKLLNQSSSFILLYFSHCLEDFARKRFGISTPLHRCIGKRPLYGQAMQLILKGHLRKAQFNVAMMVETLANDHPDVNRDEIVKLVLAIKAYYLLAVYCYTRRETVEMLKGEVSVSPAMVEDVVSEILRKCKIAIPIKPVSLEDLEEEDRLILPSPELPLEERFEAQWRRQLEIAVLAYILGSSQESSDIPEFQKLLDCLQAAKLTELEKQVLTMRYYHDMTAKEIANSEWGRQQEITVRKVFTFSDSALKKLRKVLQNYLSG